MILYTSSLIIFPLCAGGSEALVVGRLEQMESSDTVGGEITIVAHQPQDESNGED